MKISFIIPIKNETENIQFVSKELTGLLSQSQLVWNCIWIDDGSTDNSLKMLFELNKNDNRHSYISHKMNLGKSSALINGAIQSNADLIATMDGDGQNDPIDLVKMTQVLLENNASLVVGYRAERQDNFIRKISSKIGNLVRDLILHDGIIDAGCGMVVIRRESFLKLPRFEGMHRFLGTLVSQYLSEPIKQVSVNHRPRLHGISKYGVKNRIWVGLMDAITVYWLIKRRTKSEISSKSC